MSSKMEFGIRANNQIPEKTNFAAKSQYSIAGWLFGKLNWPLYYTSSKLDLSKERKNIG